MIEDKYYILAQNDAFNENSFIETARPIKNLLKTFESVKKEKINLFINSRYFLNSVNACGTSIEQTFNENDLEKLKSDQKRIQSLQRCLKNEPLNQLGLFITCCLTIKKIEDALRKSQEVTKETLEVLTRTLSFALLSENVEIQTKFKKALAQLQGNPDFLEILKSTENLKLESYFKLFSLPDEVIFHPAFHVRAYVSGIDKILKKEMEREPFENHFQNLGRLYADALVKTPRFPIGGYILNQSSKGFFIISIKNTERLPEHYPICYNHNERKWHLKDNEILVSKIEDLFPKDALQPFSQNKILTESVVGQFKY